MDVLSKAARGAAAFVIATAAVAAAPAGATELPGFGDIVVDDARRQVFVSHGDGGSGVSVFDFAGARRATLPTGGGARGLVVDGSTLYVLVAETPAVAVVDAVTLAVRTTLPIPAPADLHLVEAGGRLWFTTGSCGSELALAALDPSSGGVSSFAPPAGFGCPGLAAAPGDPGRLALWEQGSNPARVAILDVSGGTPAAVAEGTLPAANVQDIAVTPGSESFSTAAESPSAAETYAVTDLSRPTVAYPAGGRPVAVELSADARRIIVAAASAGPDVRVFPTGAGSPEITFDVPATEVVLREGLATTADATIVFAVTDGGGGAPELRVLRGDLETTSLALEISKRVVNLRGEVRVAATLSGRGIRGKEVAIVMTPAGRRPTILKAGRVDRSGTISAVARPARKTAFQAIFTGDSTHAPSRSRARTVNVRARISMKLSGHYRTVVGWKVFHYGDAPRAAVTVAPNHAGRSVTLVLQMFGDDAWHPLDKLEAPLNRRSRAVGFIVGGGTPNFFRARAVFRSDGDHLAAKSRWQRFRFSD